MHVTPPNLLGLGSYLNGHAPGIAKPVASRPPPFNPHLLLAHCRPQPYLTGKLQLMDYLTVYFILGAQSLRKHELQSK